MYTFCMYIVRILRPERFILWRILPSFENFFNLLSIIIRGKEICLDRIIVPWNEDGMH